MNPTIKRYYHGLRNYHGQSASHALTYAKERYEVERAGITFTWELEQESAESVFGEASYFECLNCRTVTYQPTGYACCASPRVKYHDTGVYYDPIAEQWSCIARSEDGTVLDSLGMIEAAFDNCGMRGYSFLIECEMSGDALAHLGELELAGETIAAEETLP